MKKIITWIVSGLLIVSCGCAADMWKKNHLKNLTDEQAGWFDRTSKDWNF